MTSDAALRADLRSLAQSGAWREAEQRVAAAIGASARGSAGAVAEFARIAAREGSPEGRGRAARLRGSWLAASRRYEESLDAYRDAAARLDGAARVGAWIGLAGSLLRCGRWRDAARWCRRARQSARRRGDPLLAAGADLNEGVALHEGGRPAAAIPLYRRAREAFASAGHGRLHARATEDLANALALIDRWDEALPLLDDAAREFDSLGLAHDAGKCRYNRGVLLVASDRLGEAEAALSDAEEALRRTGDAVTASLAKVDRGDALLRARLVPEALHVLETARRGLERARPRRSAPPGERARATLLLARAQVARGDTVTARRTLARPLPQETPALRAERTELLGLAFRAEGDSAAARRLLERAAALHGRERPAAAARARLAAAWCALDEGDLPRARRLAQVTERSATRLPHAGLVHGAAALLFLVEHRAGRRAVASRALARALSALERSRETLGSDALRSAALRGSEPWFAAAVRHVLQGRGGETRALALVERWRARALVDLLGASARVGGDEQRIAALRARLAALEERLGGGAAAPFLRGASSRAAPALARLLSVAERRLAEAWAREPAVAVAPALDLERFVREVPRGTVVLSLFADEQGGVAFAIERGRVTAVHGLADERTLAAMVEELSFRLGKFTLGAEFADRHRNRIAAETARILDQLAAATLAPAAEVLRRARRLVIVPHGAWHRVPFAALSFDGAPLVASVPIVMAPAIAGLTARVARASGAPLVLALADERAPTIVEEGRAVAASLPGAELLEGDAARCGALADGRAPSCLHVAAHGRFRSDAPAMSGVRLADGWLRAADFRRLRLDGALVVLSGCETGVSSVDAGGEVHGLVRGVLASGAAELLVSLWRVDDAGTARFMSRFHAMRSAGAGTEAALAQTQRELASAGVHPWHWAGFTLWTRRLRGDCATS